MSLLGAEFLNSLKIGFLLSYHIRFFFHSVPSSWIHFIDALHPTPNPGSFKTLHPREVAPGCRNLYRRICFLNQREFRMQAKESSFQRTVRIGQPGNSSKAPSIAKFVSLFVFSLGSGRTSLCCCLLVWFGCGFLFLVLGLMRAEKYISILAICVWLNRFNHSS